MKKLFTLFFVLLVSISLNAQIQTKFFGFTLGVSTKSYVVSTLKNRGYKVETDPDGIIHTSKLQFGGINWEYISFMFVNNKLYDIYFSINNREVTNNTLSSAYDYLKVNLSKYDEYLLEDLCSTDFYWYQDNYTRLVFAKSDNEVGMTFLTLKYTNLKLDQQKINSVQNEL